MAQLTRPKSSWELRAEAAESSLSAIRALVEQWEKEGDEAIATAMEAEAKALFVTAGSEHARGWALKECAKAIAALCPAPPEDQK